MYILYEKCAVEVYGLLRDITAAQEFFIVGMLLRVIRDDVTYQATPLCVVLYIFIPRIIIVENLCKDLRNHFLLTQQLLCAYFYSLFFFAIIVQRFFLLSTSDVMSLVLV